MEINIKKLKRVSFFYIINPLISHNILEVIINDWIYMCYYFRHINDYSRRI
jgi:hypothetical protein